MFHGIRVCWLLSTMEWFLLCWLVCPCVDRDTLSIGPVICHYCQHGSVYLVVLPHVDRHKNCWRTVDVFAFKWSIYNYSIIQNWLDKMQLLLVVGAKLDHIITKLALELQEKPRGPKGETQHVKLSNEHFWFKKPGIVLYLIQFILFQNSFEIAFFFWIWVSQLYNYFSCNRLLCHLLVTNHAEHLWISLMYHGRFGLPHSKTCHWVINSYFPPSFSWCINSLTNNWIICMCSVIIQVLCSYSTLPLYAIVTQVNTYIIFTSHNKCSFAGFKFVLSY